MKAFLGMGLLGSNFVKAMLKKGEQVQVWNRTTSRAKELEQFGAKSFEDINDVVKGVDTIHLTLKDDESVNEVLNAASGSLTQGAIIIDHTTTSKEGAIQRTKQWNERGFFYQHAPVFMGPVNALEGSGFMMVSGDQALIARLQPQLSKMTGKLLHFGPEVGKAAAMKLVGNTFLICFVAGLRDTLSMAKALSVPTSDLSSLLEDWNPASMLQARLKRMTSGDYSQPSWELNMARKDAGLFMQASENKTELAVIPSVAALMDEWIEKGYGNNDWTVIAKDVI